MNAKVTTKSAPAPTKVPALQVNAVTALDLKPTDLTENGLRTLQSGVTGSSAKVALAVFVSPATKGMSYRKLGAFLDVSKSTAENITNAGPILARCGVAASNPTVQTETLALAAARLHRTLDGKSGPTLVKAIHTAYVAYRKDQNTATPTRKAGKQTAAEKAAAEKNATEKNAKAVEKASNAQRIGGAVLFLSAVIKSGATDVTEEQIAGLFTIVSELSALVADQAKSA